MVCPITQGDHNQYGQVAKYGPSDIQEYVSVSGDNQPVAQLLFSVWPSTGHVQDRIHGPYTDTAVYTADGRVRALYTAVNAACTRVYTARTRNLQNLQLL